MKKLIFFLITSTLIIIFLIVVNHLANSFIYKPLIKNIEKVIHNINNLKPYIEKNHHAREWRYLEMNKSFDNLIYTKRENKFAKKRIIFQGDSWAEMNISLPKSNEKINKISMEKKYEIYESGITSYSFSPMTMQLRYLRKNFKVDADMIITVVDHTDVNDELCRYKDDVVIKNNKLIKINLEDNYSGQIYNYKIDYHSDVEKILNQETFTLVKIARLAFTKIKFILIQKYYLKTNQVKKRCQIVSANKILSKKKINEKDLIYLKRITNIYINEVFANKKNIILVFVIHPWKIHYDREERETYLPNLNDNEIFYWGDFLNEIINNRDEKKNIYMINFKDRYPNIYLKKGIKENEIHIKNDKSYHLSDNAHLIFLDEIYDFINNLFNKIN